MKNQSTRRKDTVNNPIYKVTDIESYRSEILEIIEAHYCYRAHLDYWGKLFTTGSLRPELAVDYSGVLAEMLCMPDMKKEISNILEKNAPTYETLYNSCESVFKGITQYLKSKNYSDKVTITHEILKSILRQSLAIERLQDELMFCDLFRVKASAKGGTHAFDRNYESSSYHIESICDTIFQNFGLPADWKEDDRLWRCIMDIKDLDPLTSKNIDVELDEYLRFIFKLINTINPYGSSLKVA